MCLCAQKRQVSIGWPAKGELTKVRLVFFCHRNLVIGIYVKGKGINLKVAFFSLEYILFLKAYTIIKCKSKSKNYIALSVFFFLQRKGMREKRERTVQKYKSFSFVGCHFVRNPPSTTSVFNSIHFNPIQFKIVNFHGALFHKELRLILNAN